MIMRIALLRMAGIRTADASPKTEATAESSGITAAGISAGLMGVQSGFVAKANGWSDLAATTAGLQMTGQQLSPAVKNLPASAPATQQSGGVGSANQVQEVSIQSGNYPEGYSYIVQAHIPNNSGVGANTSHRWARIYGINSKAAADSLVSSGIAVTTASQKQWNKMRAVPARAGDRVKVGIEYLPQNTSPSSFP